jgi:hypothetical protein
LVPLSAVVMALRSLATEAPAQAPSNRQF